MFCALSPVCMQSNLETAAKPAKQRISLLFNRTTAIPEKDPLPLASGKYSRQRNQVRQCPEALVICYRKKGREKGGKEGICNCPSQLSRGMLAIEFPSHSHMLLFSCRRGGIWKRMAWVILWNWPKYQLPRSVENKHILPVTQDVTMFLYPWEVVIHF